MLNTVEHIVEEVLRHCQGSCYSVMQYVDELIDCGDISKEFF